MKTIFLLRHSEPVRGSKLENESIVLSEAGRKKARALASRIHADAVLASEFERAKETASYLSADYRVDARFNERALGDRSTLDEHFWARQYKDPEYKNTGGESFAEVGTRMDAGIKDCLCALAEGQCAAVVSHAAAICAYLMRYCTVTVLDAKQKLRRVEFGGRVVLEGKIETPDGFKLVFDGEALADISRI